MPYSIVLSPDAVDDIDKAVDYYNGLSTGLGIELLKQSIFTYKKLRYCHLPPPSATIRFG